MLRRLIAEARECGIEPGQVYDVYVDIPAEYEGCPIIRELDHFLEGYVEQFGLQDASSDKAYVGLEHNDGVVMVEVY